MRPTTRNHEWRMCACERALPAHVDTAPDPAGGTGCGMAWRVCEASHEIEERHITEVQPGGHFRQDVPAGLVLPNHHNSSEENEMVRPHSEGDATAACAVCPRPVVLADPHVTVSQQVETEHNGEVTVTESEVVEFRHLSCTQARRARRERARLRAAEIVTVCGSMRFFERMLDLAAAETAAGAIVLAPFVVLAPERQADAAEFKARLDELHRHKIAMSDRVVVVTDESGYVGESTRSEIAYATACGIPVEVLAMWRPATAPKVEGGGVR